MELDVVVSDVSGGVAQDADELPELLRTRCIEVAGLAQELLARPHGRCRQPARLLFVHAASDLFAEILDFSAELFAFLIGRVWRQIGHQLEKCFGEALEGVRLGRLWRVLKETRRFGADRVLQTERGDVRHSSQTIGRSCPYLY